MSLTNEQLAAVNHRGSAAIVSAAAGSGKTTVLVERAIKIIADTDNKTPADRLVITTFSKKAAEEIRLRLTARILAEPQSEWLDEQLVRLQDAPITTISAFCLSLLSGYEERFGLSAGYRVLDEIEMDEYLKRALDYAFEKLYSGIFTKDEIDLLHQINCTASDLPLRGILTDIYDVSMQTPYPEQWLAQKAGQYENPKDFKSMLFGIAQGEIHKLGKQALQTAYELDSLLSGSNAEKSLAADIEVLKKISNSNASELDISGVSLPSWISPRGIGDGVKGLRALLKSQFDEIYDKYKLIKSFDKSLELQLQMIVPLVKLYEIFAAEFKRLKTSANALDFSDVEHYALQLLQTESQLLSECYDEIIVDEFQDSNFVQYEIFRLLSKNEQNLFFVGDIKQSIYRFRSADPKVFTEVMNKPEYKTLYLNRNFRSSNEVIDSVNKVFAAVMSKELGGVDYDESQRLVPGLNLSYGKRAETELCILGKDDCKAHNVKSHELEARYIAFRIREMVDGGYQITDKDGNSRSCNYDDFAVIFRALSGVQKVYIRVFEEYGIPVSRGGKGGEYVKLREIDAVLKLLEVIFDPYKDLELLTVLMSPLFGFPAEEIGEIRRKGKKIPLFSNLLAAEKTPKTESFLKNLMRWRAMSENQPLSALLADISGSEAVNCLVSSSVHPDKAAANINLLSYYAQSVSELTKGASYAFLRLMNNIRDSGKRLGEADLTQSEDSTTVKLLTIHASKGLEYPICFIADCSGGFNMRDTFSNVIVDKEFGFAMRYIEPDSKIRFETLTHQTAVVRIKAEALNEEMRKLYVAMTRARDKLILVATEKVEYSTVYSSAKPSYLNIVTNSPPFESRLGTKVALECVFPNVADYFEANTVNLTNAHDEQEDVVLDVKPYWRATLAAIPKKLTATEINTSFMNNSVFEESDEPSVFPRTPSFLKNTRLTGKKRGDVYHKVMELIDFAEGDYLRQLESLKPRFTPEEWYAVNHEDIVRFFRCELGMRASKAKVEKEFPLYTEASFAELGCADLDLRFSERPFVQGIADMFFYEDGGIILVDYKTNRNTTAQKLKRDYEGQLLVYKRALQEMTGLLVRECWLYSFEIGAVPV